MTENFFKIFGIIGIFILAVSISGCPKITTHYNLTKSFNTFNKSGVSFKYPSDFNEVKSQITISGGSDNQQLGMFESPNKITKISVSMSPLQDTPNLTIQNVKDSTKEGWKNSSDIQYYSDVKLNLTGIPEAYEVIDTMTNPENNESTKSVDLFLGQQGKAAYFISFIGPSTTFSNTQDLYNNVLPTIQIQ